MDLVHQRVSETSGKWKGKALQTEADRGRVEKREQRKGKVKGDRDDWSDWTGRW